MMTESEFNKIADAILLRVENAFDQCSSDVDFFSDGSVLEIDFINRDKLIINRHVANREIWVAAKSGGFHFKLMNEQWISQRDGSELFATLQALTQLSTGESIVF